MNIWQGNFPEENTAEDGFVTTGPVSSHPSAILNLFFRRKRKFKRISQQEKEQKLSQSEVIRM